MCKVVLIKATPVYQRDIEGFLYRDETLLPAGMEIDVDPTSHSVRIMGKTVDDVEEQEAHRLLMDNMRAGRHVLTKDIAELLPQPI